MTDSVEERTREIIARFLARSSNSSNKTEFIIRSTHPSIAKFLSRAHDAYLMLVANSNTIVIGNDTSADEAYIGIETSSSSSNIISKLARFHSQNITFSAAQTVVDSSLIPVNDSEFKEVHNINGVNNVYLSTDTIAMHNTVINYSQDATSGSNLMSFINPEAYPSTGYLEINAKELKLQDENGFYSILSTGPSGFTITSYTPQNTLINSINIGDLNTSMFPETPGGPLYFRPERVLGLLNTDGVDMFSTSNELVTSLDEITTNINSNINSIDSSITSSLNQSSNQTNDYINNLQSLLNTEMSDYIQGNSNTIIINITSTSNSIISASSTSLANLSKYIIDTSNSLAKQIIDSSNNLYSRILSNSLTTSNNTDTTSNQFITSITTSSNTIISAASSNTLASLNNIDTASNSFATTLNSTSISLQSAYFASNINISNLVQSTSNTIMTSVASSSNDIYQYLSQNQIYGNINRYIDSSSNSIVTGISSSSNTLSSSINTLNLDKIQNGTSNQYIVNNVYANDLNVSNLRTFGNIVPSANMTYDLGTPTRRWKDLYVSQNSINLGDTVISIDPASNSLNVKKASGGLSELATSKVKLLDKTSGLFTEVKYSGNTITTAFYGADGTLNNAVSSQRTTDSVPQGTSNLYFKSSLVATIVSASNLLTSNLASNLNANVDRRLRNLTADHISTVGTSNQFILNNKYNQSLTVNAKVTVASNLTIRGQSTYIKTNVYETENIEIRTAQDSNVLSISKDVAKGITSPANNINTLEFYNSETKMISMNKFGFAIGPTDASTDNSNMFITGSTTFTGDLTDGSSNLSSNILQYLSSLRSPVQAQLNTKTASIASTVSGTAQTFTSSLSNLQSNIYIKLSSNTIDSSNYTGRNASYFADQLTISSNSLDAYIKRLDTNASNYIRGTISLLTDSVQTSSNNVSNLVRLLGINVSNYMDSMSNLVVTTNVTDSSNVISNRINYITRTGWVPTYTQSTRIYFNSNVGIGPLGSTSVSNPSEALDVIGSIRFSDSLINSINTVTSNELFQLRGLTAPIQTQIDGSNLNASNYVDNIIGTQQTIWNSCNSVLTNRQSGSNAGLSSLLTQTYQAMSNQLLDTSNTIASRTSNFIQRGYTRWQGDGNNLYITRNVGIGTSNVTSGYAVEVANGDVNITGGSARKISSVTVDMRNNLPPAVWYQFNDERTVTNTLYSSAADASTIAANLVCWYEFDTGPAANTNIRNIGSTFINTATSSPFGNLNSRLMTGATAGSTDSHFRRTTIDCKEGVSCVEFNGILTASANVAYLESAPADFNIRNNTAIYTTPAAFPLMTNHGMTIAFWIKINAFGADMHIISHQNIRIHRANIASGDDRLRITFNGPFGPQIATSDVETANNLATPDWEYWVFTFAYATVDTTNIKWYRNGVMTYDKSGANWPSSSATDSKFAIGGFYDNSQQYVNGNFFLDDFRIYNKALTQAEANDLYFSYSTQYADRFWDYTNLELWYNFQTNYPDLNKNVLDSSGKSRHAIANTATYDATRKPFGYSSARYDGSKYTDLPASVNLYNIYNGANSAISFSFWFNMKNDSASYARLFEFAATGSENVQLSAGITVNNTVSILRDNLNPQITATIKNNGSLQTTPSININYNTWNHFVWVISNGTWSCYLNNSVVNIGSITAKHIPNVSYTIRSIGRSGTQDDRSFSGNIDDFRIYSKALTSGEVNQLYLAISATNIADPTALYTFEDSTNSDALGISTGTGAAADYLLTNTSVARVTADKKVGTAAAQFNGTSSRFSSISAASIWTPDNMTVAFWGKVIKNAAATQYLAAYNTSGSNYTWAIYLVDDVIYAVFGVPTSNWVWYRFQQNFLLTDSSGNSRALTTTATYALDSSRDTMLLSGANKVATLPDANWSTFNHLSISFWTKMSGLNTGDKLLNFSDVSLLPDDTSDMIAWYKFDNNFNDSTTNGYNLTNNNVTFDATNKKIGSHSALFTSSGTLGIPNNTTDQYLTNTSINLSERDFSIAFWIRLTANTIFGQQYWIVSQGNSASTAKNLIIGWLADKWFFGFYSDDINGTPIGGTASAIDTAVKNVWVHLACTFKYNYNANNSVNNEFKLYTNGALDVTRNSRNEIKLETQTFRIGRTKLLNFNGFIGQIDDFRIYNRVLSSSEINALYNYTSPAASTNNITIKKSANGLNFEVNNTALSALSPALPAVSDNTWTHVLWKIRDSTGGVTGLVRLTNNVSVSESTFTLPIVNSATYRNWLGSSSNVAGGSIYISDFRIITAALTDDIKNELFYGAPLLTYQATGITSTASWQHFAISVTKNTNTVGSAPNGTATLYLNGAIVKTLSGLKYNNTTNGTFLIGSATSAGASLLANTSIIDDFRMYSRTLSFVDIQSIYALPTAYPFAVSKVTGYSVSAAYAYKNAYQWSGNAAAGAADNVFYTMPNTTNINALLTRFHNNQAFSIHFVFRTTSIASGIKSQLFYIGQGSTDIISVWSFENTINFKVGNVTPNCSFARIAANTYYIVGLTFSYDSTVNKYATTKMWINGLLVDSEPPSNAQILYSNFLNIAEGSVSSLVYYIGKGPASDTTNDASPALLQDFRIFDKEFTPKQVADLKTSILNYTEPLVWYQFNEDPLTQGTISDSSTLLSTVRNIKYPLENTSPFVNDTTNLYFWYKFDTTNPDTNAGLAGSSGNLTISKTTTAATATIASKISTTDFVRGDGSLNFSDQNYQLVTSAYNFTTNFTNFLTISFWIKISSTTQSNVINGSKIVIGPRNGFWAYDVFGNTSYWGNSDTTVSYTANNVWEHYVWVFDKNTSASDAVRLNLYKNGVLVFTRASISTWAVPTSSTISIGTVNTATATGSSFIGMMDDFRIYNKVLSAAEVSVLYNGNYNRNAAYTSTDYPLENLTGLTAWYRFRGTNITDDFSGNFNNLSIGGTAPTKETAEYVVDSTSAKIAAASSYFTITNGSGTANFSPDNFTVACWCSIRQNSYAVQTIANAAKLDENENCWYGWEIKVVNNDLVLSTYANTASTKSGSGNTNTTIYTGFAKRPILNSGYTEVLNSWIHFAVTINKTTQTARLYINGSMFGDNLTIKYSNDKKSNFLTIGADESNENNIQQNSLLQDFRFYNRVLTATEVAFIAKGNWQQYYNNGGLQAWYRFDARSGTPADLNTDFSGNNFHFTNSSNIEIDTSGPKKGNSVIKFIEYEGANKINFVELENALSLATFSVSCWCNIGSATGASAVTQSIANCMAKATNYFGWAINVYYAGTGTTNNLVFETGNGTATLQNSTISRFSSFTSAWNHLVVTFTSSGSSCTVFIYVNGVQVYTGTQDYSVSIAPTRLILGYRGTDKDRKLLYGSMIDDFRFYSRVLTAAEVYQIYSPTPPQHYTLQRISGYTNYAFGSAYQWDGDTGSSTDNTWLTYSGGDANIRTLLQHFHDNRSFSIHFVLDSLDITQTSSIFFAGTSSTTLVEVKVYSSKLYFAVLGSSLVQLEQAILNNNTYIVDLTFSYTSTAAGGMTLTMSWYNATAANSATFSNSSGTYNNAFGSTNLASLSGLRWQIGRNETSTSPDAAPVFLQDFRIFPSSPLTTELTFYRYIGVQPTIVDADKTVSPTAISDSTYYYAFTSTSGTNTITFNKAITCDVLLIGGGGGGGGNIGGGGGAGACIVSLGYSFNAGTYTITVGNGGAGGSGTGVSATRGYDSSIVSDSNNIFIARGGGGAGNFSTTSGLQGGSSGGSAPTTVSTVTSPSPLTTNVVNTTANIAPTAAGTLSVSGQTYIVLGTKGGDAVAWSSPDNSTKNCGGGGGIGAVGANSTISTPGKGGNGAYQVTINGKPVNFKSYFSPNSTFGVNDGSGNFYIGGGGGGAGFNSSATTNISGGLGGGSSGLKTTANTDARPANNNTGSGGGGGSVNGNGGNGGSGIVIIRWTLANQSPSQTVSSTALVTASGIQTGEIVNTTTYPNYQALRWMHGPAYYSINNPQRFIKYTDGNVGIGIINPDTKLHVNSGTASTNSGGKYFAYQALAPSLQTESTATTDICSVFENSILVSGSVASSSDTRIKKNISDINDDSALQQILSIQPKTYNYIADVIHSQSNTQLTTPSNQPRTIYGFIAQQIKDVIPSAVTTQTETIPNIYSYANVNNNVITFTNPTNTTLAINDKIDIIDITEKRETYTIISTDTDNNSITVDRPITGDKVFVYGTQVSDFNTLNKSYIYTLNVCATQTLSNKIDQLKSRLSALIPPAQEQPSV